MTLPEIEIKLFKGAKMLNPIINGTSIEGKEGYYAIWVTDVKKLPLPFSEELLNRETNLLYIGIGSGSLFKRLYQQELQHLNPATFFRSIGAVLGYKPERGSLQGKKNQKNYKFSKSDTHAITGWINLHLEVSFCYGPTIQTPFNTFEKELIKKYTPLLNWTHNPKKIYPLKRLKEECRAIAKTSVEIKK